MTVHVNWRQDAACRDADPELFFPVGTTGPALRQIREAKRICRGCPAQAPCLAWALDHGVTDGVWGATTEGQRRADVVLMDEPASALDPIATGRIEDLMQELRQRYTIVIVTHNMQQATRVSDRTAFFSVLTDSANDTPTGILIESGPTRQIFEDPRDSRTQAYVTGRIG